MKLALSTVVVIVFLGGSALAGSGSAKLSCEPKAGEKSTVSLKGLLPDSEETLELTLSDGIASIRMTDEDADAYRIEAFEQSVFSIIIKRRQVFGEISLYAIPKTVKAKKRAHSTHATFDAVMRAPNPQHQGPVRSAADMLPRITMSCTYDYEI